MPYQCLQSKLPFEISWFAKYTAKYSAFGQLTNYKGHVCLQTQQSFAFQQLAFGKIHVDPLRLNTRTQLREYEDA